MSMVARLLSGRWSRPAVDARQGLAAAAEWLVRAQYASVGGCFSA